VPPTISGNPPSALRSPGAGQRCFARCSATRTRGRSAACTCGCPRSASRSCTASTSWRARSSCARRRCVEAPHWSSSSGRRRCPRTACARPSHGLCRILRTCHSRSWRKRCYGIGATRPRSSQLRPACLQRGASHGRRRIQRRTTAPRLSDRTAAAAPTARSPDRPSSHRARLCGHRRCPFRHHTARRRCSRRAPMAQCAIAGTASTGRCLHTHLATTRISYPEVAALICATSPPPRLSPPSAPPPPPRPGPALTLTLALAQLPLPLPLPPLLPLPWVPPVRLPPVRLRRVGAAAPAAAGAPTSEAARKLPAGADLRHRAQP